MFANCPRVTIAFAEEGTEYTVVFDVPSVWFNVLYVSAIYYPPNAITFANEMPGPLDVKETFAVPVGPCSTLTETVDVFEKLILLALILDPLLAVTAKVFPLICDVGSLSIAI
jgi:hypothetical protein